MQPIDVIAHLLLPFVALATWHHSKLVSAAFIAAFAMATTYLLHPYDALRWACAGLTGAMGLAALGMQLKRRYQAARWNARFADAFGFSVAFPRTPDVLASLLVGSSVADYVSLWRESQGHAWGSLSFWQVVVCLAMVLLSWLGRRTPREEHDRDAALKMLEAMKQSLMARRSFGI